MTNENLSPSPEPDNGATSQRRGYIALAAVAVVIVAVLGAINLLGGGDGSRELPDVKSATEEAEVLAADDPKGSPHVVLPEAFDPEANADAKVPDDMKKDADEVLTVEEASLDKGNGPYDLVWKLKRAKGDPVACVNCAFIDKRLKTIVAGALESDAAEGISRIIGLDPTRLAAGDYAGNGWQVEFVVGSTASGYKAGEELAGWLLSNAKDKHIHSILWRNLFYSEADSCTAELDSTEPVEAFPQDISDAENPGAARDAGMDRIIVASPSYTPQFEDRDGAQFVTGWKATGC